MLQAVVNKSWRLTFSQKQSPLEPWLLQTKPHNIEFQVLLEKELTTKMINKNP